jgi:hypothetical protein
LNVVGYGVGNPYVAPLQTPVTLLDWWDKYTVTMATSSDTVNSIYFQAQ